jgi:outer membrane protein assembly factor BamA
MTVHLAYLMAAALALLPGLALAQAPPSPPAERVDLVDLARKAFKRPPPPAGDPDRTRMALAPIFASKPTTGFRLGVGATFEIALGDETARLSSVNTGLSFSTKKQLAFTFQPMFYGGSGRWLLDGENQITPSGVSDVAGGDLAARDGDQVSYHSLRFFDTYARRLRRNLYAGLGLFYARQSDFSVPAGTEATSPFLTYSAAHGFDTDSQVAAGPGVSLIFDSRDHPNDASRGALVSLGYRMHVEGFLGGDSTWQRLIVDLRTYRPLTASGHHRLAVWSLIDLVTGGTAPYLSRPTTGGDLRGRSSRGYAEGQVRGDRLTALEVEYRGTITKNALLGWVLFANATTVSDESTGVGLFDRIDPAAGAGLRVLVHKRSRTHLCLDVGAGRRGSYGIYLALADVF